MEANLMFTLTYELEANSSKRDAESLLQCWKLLYPGKWERINNKIVGKLELGVAQLAIKENPTAFPVD